MLYIFVKELGSKKVGDKVNMNLNIQSMLITEGYVKRVDKKEAEEVKQPKAKEVKVKEVKQPKAK